MGLFHAMLQYGLKHGEEGFMGKTLWEFWRKDVSAKDMLKSTHGFTSTIGHAQKLAGYDVSGLKEGDLAVTDNGIHVLIYAGGGKWIEANPADGKVVVNPAPANSKRAYFNTPVIFVRWWILH